MFAKGNWVSFGAPTHRCPKGHEINAYRICVDPGQGGKAIQHEFCLVCALEWLEIMFPTKPIDGEGG